MLKLTKDHVLEDAPLALTINRATGPECEIIDWSVAVEETRRFHGVIRLTFELPDIFTAPWVLVPGFFYGENRRADQKGRLYPRFDPALRDPCDIASAWWDFGVDRTASPLVYVHQNRDSLALAVEPHPVLDGSIASDDPEPQFGLGFGFHEGVGHIRVSYPACEEPFAYTAQPDPAPRVCRARMEPGSRVSGRLYLYRFAADRHGYQRVIEHFSAILQRQHAAAEPPPLLPLVEDALHGIVVGHYHESRNYFVYSRCFDAVAEQIANAKNMSLEWHQDMVGFVGGLMVCHGLLAGSALTGDARAKAVAHRVADRICRDGLSPSGLFWADYVPEAVETINGTYPNPLANNRPAYGSGWLSKPGWVHSRTIADACDHLAAMLDLLRARGEAWPLAWETALANNLRVALDLQLADGSYGQYYDAVTKHVAKLDGCGGLLWIPAMLKAVELGLGGPKFSAEVLASVRRAGEAYAPYVERECIWGAPEDNDSPTSEDGMNAVMAYCDLYAATQEARWLALARTAADWMLTFRRTFNQRLPENSLMGRYGMKSRGGDFASVSNNHLHVFEALCTRHLCRLSDWTGNAYYRQRARDHWGFVSQYLCRCDGMYNGFRGAMSEQFYWTDWGSWGGTYRLPPFHRQKGNVAGFSTVWCAAIIPLAAMDAQREFY